MVINYDWEIDGFGRYSPIHQQKAEEVVSMGRTSSRKPPA